MFRTLESLESRTLFAAAPVVPTVVQVGATIEVVGTKWGDDIHVRLSADVTSLEVLHNGQQLGSYALDTIALVRVDGGKGHDNLHLDANVMVAAHLAGGAGNDILVGGGLGDHLRGMLGKDNLSGGDGNDLLDGAQAPDVLSGGAGDDRIFGGHGMDVLDGGFGVDILTGGKGWDALTGGEGVDSFIGSDQFWELRDFWAAIEIYTFLSPKDIIGGIIDDFFGL